MGKKKVKRNVGKPFAVGGDIRSSHGAPSTETIPVTRKREPRSIYENVQGCRGSVPPGATLRPFDDSGGRESGNLESCDLGERDSQNWLIDEGKLFEATNDALKSHGTGKRANHIPQLKKHQVSKVGLGLRLQFRCKFKNCRFVSKAYELYQKTESGQPLSNLQLGVAMSKTDLTARTVEILGTTLNLDMPGDQTLRNVQNRALSCVEALSEKALMENRKEVTSTLRLRGEIHEGEVPSADVAIDGQFSNRSYHFPTGKSDSVSVPVVEQVTGRGLIVEHVNLSHRDGSLPANIHINSGETMAARLNYVKSYQSADFPLHYGVVTTDGDTGLVKALEAGRMSVGESRPLKRRGCIFHAESAAKRKFMRESLMKMTPNQKSQLAESQSKALLPEDLGPNTCPACLKVLKSSKGLTIHKRSCKGERAEECKIKGLEPLFQEWESKGTHEKLSVISKKAWRDGIRRWVIKRIKTEMNLGIHALNPGNCNIPNDSEIHEALHLAGKTIIPCLSGCHDGCLQDSRGCNGPDSPPDYQFLPGKSPIGPIPAPTKSWLISVVDMLLSKESLHALVVNGKKATTSLVESSHKEIRIPVPKGRVYRKNETRLIKSGMNKFD